MVLAAGMGSRYGGLKQLDAVGPHRETIIDFSVYDAIRAGFGKVVFVLRDTFADQFMTTIGRRFEHRIDVAAVLQSIQPDIAGVGTIPRTKPWGTGHALLAAKPAVDGPFAVINADDYYGRDSYRLMAEFLITRASPVKFSMVGFQLVNTLSANGSVARGIGELNHAGHLVSVIERTQIAATGTEIFDQYPTPPLKLPEDALASMNFWGFDPAIFHHLEHQFITFARANTNSETAEFFIPTVVNRLLQNGTADCEVLHSGEQWYGVTYQQDKPVLQQALASLVQNNHYDSPLWKA